MKTNETGRRLAEFAKKWGVPFEFHAMAGKWESFTAKDFNLRNDEVLAVTSYKVHHMSDESVVGASPRDLLLRRIRSLNPKVNVAILHLAYRRFNVTTCRFFKVSLAESHIKNQFIFRCALILSFLTF